MNGDHEILPHGEFRELEANLWTMEGELPHHNPLKRTMTVYKMRNGGLWIHSAIGLNDEAQKKLESLGRPKYLVIPNSMHRLDASIYKSTYPDIIVVCPKGAKKKVEEELHVDNSCENVFNSDEIRALRIDGAKNIELAYEIDLGNGKGKALIMNDLLVNICDAKGLGGLALKLIGRIGFFRTPPLTKLLLLKQRKAFKKWLIRQSEKTDLTIVTVSHGRPVHGNISGLLLNAANEV